MHCRQYGGTGSYSSDKTFLVPELVSFPEARAALRRNCYFQDDQRHVVVLRSAGGEGIRIVHERGQHLGCGLVRPC
jgi:hypothetical protein